MEAMRQEENESVLEPPVDNLAMIWEELPAEKHREALQALALLLVKGVEEGGKDEQPV
jgi:hypothetical protein